MVPFWSGLSVVFVRTRMVRVLQQSVRGVSLLPIALVTLALTTGATHLHSQPGAPSGTARESITPDEFRSLEREPVRAIGAINATTIVVLVSGREVPVQIRGVRGPDPREPSAARIEGIAAYVLHNWVAGEMIRCAGLQRVRGGGLEAFLDRTDDRHDIGGELIRQGYLRLDDGDRSHARHAVWAEAQEQAALYGKGQWGEVRPRIDPAWFADGAVSTPRPVSVPLDQATPLGLGESGVNTPADQLDSGPATDAVPAVTEPERPRILIYVTPSGSRYHLATCRFSRTAAPIDPEDARNRYSPCSVCRPPELTDLIGPRD